MRAGVVSANLRHHEIPDADQRIQVRFGIRQNRGEHGAAQTAEFRRLERRDILPVKPNPSAFDRSPDRRETENGSEEQGFPGARSSNNTEPLAASKRELNLVKQRFLGRAVGDEAKSINP
jgi:hypothetical protein